MSERQLLQVAKRLGKEWKQVAIYLDLSSRDLDDIQAAEKDVTMQKLKMLVEWKSRRAPGHATPSHLWTSVKDLDDLPLEIVQTLEGKHRLGFGSAATCCFKSVNVLSTYELSKYLFFSCFKYEKHLATVFFTLKIMSYLSNI